MDAPPRPAYSALHKATGGLEPPDGLSGLTTRDYDGFDAE